MQLNTIRKTQPTISKDSAQIGTNPYSPTLTVFDSQPKALCMLIC